MRPRNKDGLGNAGPKSNMKNSILAIAGSDSISGAGVQIDIKVAASLGVHATCAITAVTAQNTMGVYGVEQMSGEMVRAQIQAVFEDVPPQAIKIGMLGSVEVANAVSDELQKHRGVPVVLDPVLVATSGASLAENLMVETLCESLLPLSTLVTPNLPEVASLTGIDLTSSPCGLDAQNAQETQRELDNKMCAAATKLVSFGSQNVLIKGGHEWHDLESSDNLRADDLNSTDNMQADELDSSHNIQADMCIDRLYASQSVYSEGGLGSHKNAELVLELKSRRASGEFHGTGCSLSTAIACGLAQGLELKEAVHTAHEKINSMITHPTNMGKGCTIINPFV